VFCFFLIELPCSIFAFCDMKCLFFEQWIKLRVIIVDQRYALDLNEGSAIERIYFFKVQGAYSFAKSSEINFDDISLNSIF